MFVPTTGFTRGEVDSPLWDRVDVDFYRSAVRHMENWMPDLTGAATRRAPWVYEREVPVAKPGSRPYMFSVEMIGDPVFFYVVNELGVGDTPHDISIYTYRPRVLPEFQWTKHDTTGVWLADHALSVSFTQAGPAVIVVSPHFPPLRFFGTGGPGEMEIIEWREEILGTVEVEINGVYWGGTDTLFAEQFQSNDKFTFRGKEYTVDAVLQQDGLTTVEPYTGPSTAGQRITRVADPFHDGSTYPRLVTFHRGRLFLFSTGARPVTMWASAANDPFLILPGSVHDDAPIEFDLLADGAGAFLRVSSAEHIHLGSDYGEFILHTPRDLAVTPTSISFSRVTSTGSAPVRPVSAEATTYFVSTTGRQVLGTTFDDTIQGYRTTDVTLLAPHLFDSPIRQVVLLPPTPHDRTQRLLALTEAGDLRACALEEKENVAAWCRVTPPEGTVFVAIASTRSALYAAVHKDGDYGGESYLMRLEDLTTEFYLDYALDIDPQDDPIYNLPTYLRHLPLTIVSSVQGVVGFSRGDEVELDWRLYGWQAGRGETLTVGVPYASRLDLLPAPSEDGKGTLLSRRRRMVRARVSVRDTAHLMANSVPLMGTVGTQLGRRLTPRTGVLEYRQLGWDTGEDLSLETNSIYPAQILSVTREIVT